MTSPELPLRYQALNKIAEHPNSVVTRLIDWYGRKRAQNIIKASEITKCLRDGGLYVDIGGGPGHIDKEILNSAKEEHKKVRIVHTDPMARIFETVRNESKTLKKPEIGSAAAYGEKVPIASNSCDGAFMIFTLHHVGNIESVLGEAIRITKNGGHLFIVEDTPKEGKEKDVVLWDRLANGEIVSHNNVHNHLTNEAWLEKFGELGLHIEKIQEFGSKNPINGAEIPQTCYVLRVNKSGVNT